MHAFDVLGDPIRRRILEELAERERPAGTIVEIVGKEFGVTQAAVSQHLKVLRNSGFATVRVEGSRRIYAIEYGAFSEVDAYLERFRGFWEQKLDALAEEIERQKRTPG